MCRASRLRQGGQAAQERLRVGCVRGGWGERMGTSLARCRRARTCPWCRCPGGAWSWAPPEHTPPCRWPAAQAPTARQLPPSRPVPGSRRAASTGPEQLTLFMVAGCAWHTAERCSCRASRCRAIPLDASFRAWAPGADRCKAMEPPRWSRPHWSDRERRVLLPPCAIGYDGTVKAASTSAARVSREAKIKFCASVQDRSRAANDTRLHSEITQCQFVPAAGLLSIEAGGRVCCGICGPRWSRRYFQFWEATRKPARALSPGQVCCWKHISSNSRSSSKKGWRLILAAGRIGMN